MCHPVRNEIRLLLGRFNSSSRLSDATATKETKVDRNPSGGSVRERYAAPMTIRGSDGRAMLKDPWPECD